ncbi:PAN domain-containing protein [Sinorhizobium fredii]|uniref:PAN domain-containing protein n=1 Tax=Rhizobium fredii TaxID=380 RepID=UPI0035189F37
MFRSLLSVLLALAVWIQTADAADIRMERLENGALISVFGELVAGDDDRFKNLAIATDGAVVMFNSPGGLAHVGMEIGRTIAIKGFFTAVFDDDVCASSCGLAWIAGRKRFISSRAKVGFHAVFKDQDGSQNVSSAGNALVGSYLQQLNLSPNVVVYATATDPSSMQWLTAEDAERIGLEVALLPNSEAAAPANAPVPFGEGAQATLPAPKSATPSRSWYYFDYTDLPGYDLPGMPLRLATPAECQSACQANDRCSAFTFNMAHRACFLKGMATEALQFSGAVSGYYGAANDISRIGHDFGPSVRFRTSKNVEIVGKPFATIKDSNLAACQDQCVLTAACQGFSFYRNGMCLMFNVRKPTKANPRAVAGVRAD